MDRKKRRGMQILAIAAGFLMYGAAWATEGGTGQRLERKEHGEGSQIYSLEVDGLLDGQAIVEVPVRERAYSLEEAETIFDRIWEQLPAQVLNGNPSADEVRMDLVLPGWWEEYGVDIQWKTDGEIIDSTGKLHNQEIPREGRQVCLEAVLSDGRHETSRKLDLTVFPPEMTEEEQKVGRFLQELDHADREQEGQDYLDLPETFEGRPLRYERPGIREFWALPFLGIGAAVLIEIKEKERKKQEKERRDFLLMRDYPEILSKLAVFLGAGMTVRASWEQIVRRYEKELEEGRISRRPAYEEMKKTLADMEKRVPEGKAYQEFGRACGLLPYRKLAGFLEQNRREGMKNLRNLMKLEMAAAFEERKNLARKQGEEASTRLLVPLFLMLAVVMAMVMVPALLSF